MRNNMTTAAALTQNVTSGMVAFIGTGSTAYFAVERLGQLLHSDDLKNVVCAFPPPLKPRNKPNGLELCIDVK
jgi:ribose 5-phosphate isomerase